ncbi:MAG: hypothetical protein VKJ46_03090 [Leptolyngbyaceae bacterium]|nr:hypothetical protein [Leptolyngbyaceae bacterium]
MLPTFYLIASLSAFMVPYWTEAVSAGSLPMSSSATQQARFTGSTDTPDLVCYMKTADHRVLNLSRLCGKAKREPVASPAAAPANPGVDPTDATSPTSAPPPETENQENPVDDQSMSDLQNTGQMWDVNKPSPQQP